MRDTRSRVDALFDRALELPPGDREAFLERECSDAPDVKREVASLLRAHEGMSDDFLAAPAVEDFKRLRPDLAPGTRVGAYRIVRVVETGGTGTVYEAEQERPQRRVALKLMRADSRSPDARRRFLDEAEFLGRLRHPGVAHVYEAGFFDTTPFIAMEYVQGERLLDHVTRSDLPLARRVRLIADVCDAVHHGHQQGIVHLDLKPENVLVDNAGRPKVIDFGIARVVDRPVAERQALVGTLPYMSPEQCDPSATVDVRSDVYSLGVLLFETLSGELPQPVGRTTLLEATRRIREEPARRLAGIGRRFAGDLDAIAGKALARDRDQRYGSASALADDLRRHLTHRPVEAQPPGFLYHLRKFARRRRAAFVALTAIVVVSVAAAIVGGALALSESRAREDAELQAYVANIAAAEAALRVHDAAEAQQRLARAPERLRNWEWHHLRKRSDRSVRTLQWAGAMRFADASRDGTRIAAIAGDTRRHIVVRMWDTATGAEVFSLDLGKDKLDAVGLHPRNEQFATGYRDGRLEIRAADDGRVLRKLASVHESVIIDIAYAPAGDRMAVASRDATISIWNTATFECERVLRGHRDRVICLAFDEAGRRLASGGREGDAILWDVATGERLATFRGHSKSVEGIALNDRGRLATTSRDLTVRLWDVETQRAIAVRQEHTSNVRSVVFTADGSAFVSGSWDRSLRVWDAKDGSARGVLRGHHGQVVGVEALPDGRIVSFSRDGAVKFWRNIGAPDPAELRHDDVVGAAAFVPGGRRLLTAQLYGPVRVWDVATKRVVAEHAGTAGTEPALIALPGGTDYLLADPIRHLELRAVADGALRRKLARHPSCVCFDPTTRRVYTGHLRGHVEVHDLDGARLSNVRRHESAITAIACSPDARYLATGDVDGVLRLWTLDRFEQRAQARLASRIGALAFAPDGASLAIVTDGPTPEVRRTTDLFRLHTLRGHSGRALAVAFTPDGTRLATTSWDATVRLWDAATGAQMLVLRGHRFPVWSLSFSDDGRRLASGDGSSEDRLSSIRLWER